MMVMTDGTVLIHEDNTGAWDKLTPSSTGSYVNGTWSAVASMPSGYQPLYYASQILPTGQLLVDGGEYNGSNTEVWTTKGAIYNPITNTWASVSPPPTVVEHRRRSERDAADRQRERAGPAAPS